MAVSSAAYYSNRTRGGRWLCPCRIESFRTRTIQVTDSQSTVRGLVNVRKFIIGRPVLNETIRFLKKVGRTGAEGFVLWGGKLIATNTFQFTTAIVPVQHSHRTDRGLLVVVDGEALFKVNKALYERDEILGGQVHTHPTSAYHSSTDDHYPLVTLGGALSVVLPDFARNAPADVAMWAWYRLMEYGKWKPINKTTKVVFK